MSRSQSAADDEDVFTDGRSCCTPLPLTLSVTLSQSAARSLDVVVVALPRFCRGKLSVAETTCRAAGCHIDIQKRIFLISYLYGAKMPVQNAPKSTSMLPKCIWFQRGRLRDRKGIKERSAWEGRTLAKRQKGKEVSKSERKINKKSPANAKGNARQRCLFEGPVRTKPF